MKRLMNAVETVAGREPRRLRRCTCRHRRTRGRAEIRPPTDPDSRQGRADLRRRLWPRTAARRLRRPWHAGRSLSGPSLYFADARPDGRSHRSGRYRRGMPDDRQELRRRRHELRHGRRARRRRPKGGIGRDQRRRRRSQLDLVDRTARRRWHSRRGEDPRRCGRAVEGSRNCGISASR